MSEQFGIAAGGSGVRVAEALIHLCAAGLGPDSIHLLVVDVDNTNGNLTRLRSTVDLYSHCSQWKWGKESNGRRPFLTKFSVHYLTADLPISSAGIEDVNFTPDEYKDVLNILYDESEQSTDAERGFKARPNIGSLLMAGYLADAFSDTDSGAKGFGEALLNELSNDGDEKGPSLVVVGSVFGGTGASIIPVVMESLRDSLTARPGGNQAALRKRFDKLRSSVVMMLPYFQPQLPPADQNLEETVDPGRFLTDTQNALSHYERSGAYKGYSTIYLVGAENPGREKPKFCTGSDGQANAPMIEEMIAALAVIDAVAESRPSETTVKAFRPTNLDKLKLNNLPWKNGGSDMDGFVNLLHMAAFAIKSHDKALGKGVIAFLDAHANNRDELELWPWYAHFQNQSGSLAIKASENGADRMGKYFYRLLEWSRWIFDSSQNLNMLELQADANCFHYWEAATLTCGEDHIPTPTQDGIPVHVSLLLSAASGIPNFQPNGKKTSGKNILSKNPEKWLLEGRGPHKVILPFAREEFEVSRKMLGLSETKEYHKTKPE